MQFHQIVLPNGHVLTMLVISHANQPLGGLPGVGQMAYAAFADCTIVVVMRDTLPLLPADGETIAELRELYRAAESRAARMRLLSNSARDLAEANGTTLEEVVGKCAQRLAFFVGCRSAEVLFDEQPSCIHSSMAISAPGDVSEIVAWLTVDGLSGLDDIPDEEDRDAFQMELDLLGLTIHRVRKDQERAQLVSRLQEREKTLGKLLDQIFTAQEEERRRVSHELHDGVAQTATALVRILESPAAATRDDEHAIKPAEVARGLVAELRRVIAGLRPTLLDDLGLLPALQALFEALEADGFAVDQNVNAREVRLSPLVETAVFRVAQEAVSNIRKHAGGPCKVRVFARLDSEPLLLRIEDEGVGPSEENQRDGALTGNNVGVEVMRERMAAIGGSLSWGAGQSRGVFVEARFPADV